MPLHPITFVSAVNEIHREAVVRWHAAEIDNPYADLLGVVCQQHQYNFLLWHEEDVARSPDAGDTRIAEVKRAIDRYNQLRNDHIELIDESLLDALAQAGVKPHADARLNTETPGSVVDRLSIMSLRIFHLEEQLARRDADPAHRQRVADRLARCRLQQADLAQSLRELVADLLAGNKRLKVYRQLKMYNDPTLNPYLYRRGQAA